MEEHLDLEEGRRLQAAKDFVSRNRFPLIAAVVAVILGAAAGYGWHQYRQGRLIEASEHYQAAVSALQEERSGDARVALRTLTEDYTDTPYGAFGRVLRARILHAGGDSQQALEVLAPVAEGEAGPAYARHVAVEERARIRWDRGDVEGALDALEPLAEEAYLASYFQLQGDLLAANGQPEAARAAYEEARKAPGSSALQPGLKARLDRLPSPAGAGDEKEDGAGS